MLQTETLANRSGCLSLFHSWSPLSNFVSEFLFLLAAVSFCSVCLFPSLSPCLLTLPVYSVLDSDGVQANKKQQLDEMICE